MNGEGLQHEDGHSLLLASVVPTVHAYDPAFAYEMATIVERGIDHMFGPQAEDCIYYLTLYNENYPMPALPVPQGDEALQAEAAASLREGILRGIYRYAGPAGAAAASSGCAETERPAPPSAMIGSCCTWTCRLNRLPTDSSLIPSIIAVNMS